MKCGKLGKGFTIVEIMIVVAIIVVIMAMALPNYLRARETAAKEACISNLWSISEAIKQFVLDNNIAEGTSLSGYEDEIYGYIRFSKPTCSSGGTYIFGTVSSENAQVTCSKETDLGHKVP